MTIPQNDLLPLIIGSIASITSFLITILYSIKQKRMWMSREKKLEKVSLTIQGKTINIEAHPKDVKKILSILRKYQSDDISSVRSKPFIFK